MAITRVNNRKAISTLSSVSEHGVEPGHTRGEDAHRQSVVARCRACDESLSLAIQIGREDISKTALHRKGWGGGLVVRHNARLHMHAAGDSGVIIRAASGREGTCSCKSFCRPNLGSVFCKKDVVQRTREGQGVFVNVMGG